MSKMQDIIKEAKSKITSFTEENESSDQDEKLGEAVSPKDLKKFSDMLFRLKKTDKSKKGKKVSEEVNLHENKLAKKLRLQYVGGWGAKMKHSQEGVTDSKGNKQGPWKYFWRNGKVSAEGNYKNGVEDGIWKYYNMNGKLASKETWKNNDWNGPVEMYHDDTGKIAWKGTFKNFDAEGWHYHYNNHGDLVWKGLYKNDERKEFVDLRVTNRHGHKVVRPGNGKVSEEANPKEIKKYSDMILTMKRVDEPGDGQIDEPKREPEPKVYARGKSYIEPKSTKQISAAVLRSQSQAAHDRRMRMRYARSISNEELADKYLAMKKRVQLL